MFVCWHREAHMRWCGHHAAKDCSKGKLRRAAKCAVLSTRGHFQEVFAGGTTVVVAYPGPVRRLQRSLVQAVCVSAARAVIALTGAQRVAVQE